MCTVRASTFLAISTVEVPGPATSSPQPHLTSDRDCVEPATLQDPAGQAALGLTGSRHLQVKASDGSHCPQRCASEAHTEGCCLGRLAHEAGGHSCTGGEEGEGQGLRPGGKAAPEAAGMGPKECEGELTDTQRSWRPWAPGLSPIKKKEKWGKEASTRGNG